MSPSRPGEEYGDRPRRTVAIPLLLLLAAAVGSGSAFAEVKRVVVIKLDGLPGWYVENALRTPDPETGRSRAPWIEHIFQKNGVRFVNFYTRGISLSVPSWQVLDTGYPTQIHGNAEFDRYTSHVYDYLNFFPFYVDYSRGRTADMPSVEVLDEAGIPLLLDRFPYEQRLQGFQLNQRGIRLKALPRALTSRFKGRAPQQLLDEWQAGISFGEGVFEENEKELIARLQDPDTRYLDYFSGEFDHQAHLTNDAFTKATAFDKIDRLIGRVFKAIENSPLGPETVLAVLSDHGMNTVENVYSQGYSLVDFFTSTAGGGHHVVTNRYVLQEYRLMGLDPWVHRVTTSSDNSPYLSGKHKEYPTVLLDLDGNERASVYLRNNHLNRLHMALIKRQNGLALSIINSQRDKWTKALADLRQEIDRLTSRYRDAPPVIVVKRKDRTPEEIRKGKHNDAVREFARQNWWLDARRHYQAYASSLEKLLQLDAAQLKARKFKIEELIPPGAMGEINTPEDLQSYAVDLDADGTFRTIDYLATLTALQTKNEVQKELSRFPIDFVAVADPKAGGALVYAGPDKRVRVTATSAGIRYEPLDGWTNGLPLRILEDPAFRKDQAWLEQPHSEEEWLKALHKTQYSNGLIGIAEHFNAPMTKQRALARADMLILANNHWNFNVRSFNPGGNHGSFFRISTLSVLMFWGGSKTGIGRGVQIEDPYDGLAFVPTILDLLGLPHQNLPGKVLPVLSQQR
jgi:hypothetical protein